MYRLKILIATCLFGLALSHTLFANNPIEVGTWNLNIGQPGMEEEGVFHGIYGNRFSLEARLPKIREQIESENLDILCLQGIFYEPVDLLKTMLDELGYETTPLDDRGWNRFIVAYKKNRFELRKLGSLSLKPEEADLSEKVGFVELVEKKPKYGSPSKHHEKQERIPFFVFTTNLENPSESKYLSLAQLHSVIDEVAGDRPRIIAGTFDSDLHELSGTKGQIFVETYHDFTHRGHGASHTAFHFPFEKGNFNIDDDKEPTYQQILGGEQKLEMESEDKREFIRESLKNREILRGHLSHIWANGFEKIPDSTYVAHSGYLINPSMLEDDLQDDKVSFASNHFMVVTKVKLPSQDSAGSSPDKKKSGGKRH